MRRGEMSVYKYYRPIFLLCYFAGQFPVLNVTSKHAKKLTFKHNSPAVLVAIVSKTAIFFCCVISDFLEENHTPLFGYKTFAMAIIYAVSLWIICTTNNIVKTINTVDRLRSSLSFFPNNLRPRLTNPKTFSKLLLGINVFISMFAVIIFGVVENYKAMFFTLGIAIDRFRLCMILSCIFHTCSLVVHDSRTSWRLYRRAYCRKIHRLDDFSQLIAAQTEDLKTIDEFSRYYFLVISGSGLCDIVGGLVYAVNAKVLLNGVLCNVVIWNFCLGVLVVCMHLNSFKYKQIGEEVLQMAVRDLASKDHIKVRVLLTQLENSSVVFTAAGFFKVTPDILLGFLSLGIQCIIFVVQNLSDLQKFVVPEVTSATAASNYTV